MPQVRIASETTPVFDELARDAAPYPAFTGRSAAYIANLLIEQSPCYIEAKTRLEHQPPKKIGKKS